MLFQLFTKELQYNILLSMFQVEVKGQWTLKDLDSQEVVVCFEIPIIIESGNKI